MADERPEDFQALDETTNGLGEPRERPAPLTPKGRGEVPQPSDRPTSDPTATRQPIDVAKTGQDPFAPASGKPAFGPGDVGSLAGAAHTGAPGHDIGMRGLPFDDPIGDAMKKADAARAHAWDQAQHNRDLGWKDKGTPDLQSKDLDPESPSKSPRREPQHASGSGGVSREPTHSGTVHSSSRGSPGAPMAIPDAARTGIQVGGSRPASGGGNLAEIAARSQAANSGVQSGGSRLAPTSSYSGGGGGGGGSGGGGGGISASTGGGGGGGGATAKELFASIWQIVINSPTPLTILDFGDLIQGEVQFPGSKQVQVETVVAAMGGLTIDRANYLNSIHFTKWYVSDDVPSAADGLLQQISNIPNGSYSVTVSVQGKNSYTLANATVSGWTPNGTWNNVFHISWSIQGGQFTANEAAPVDISTEGGVKITTETGETIATEA